MSKQVAFSNFLLFSLVENQNISCSLPYGTQDTQRIPLPNLTSQLGTFEPLAKIKYSRIF